MQPEAASLPGVNGPPAGALRFLARRNDTQILILDGIDRPIGHDERLVHVEWFPSEAIAEAVSGFCCHRLATSHFPSDVEGWHYLPVEHLGNLITNAKAELNISYHPRDDAKRDRQAWTGERIALLGYLAGLGWTAKRIAEHPMIRSTEGNVYKQAHKLSRATQDELVLRRLPTATRSALATSRRTSRTVKGGCGSKSAHHRTCRSRSACRSELKPFASGTGFA